MTLNDLIKECKALLKKGVPGNSVLTCHVLTEEELQPNGDADDPECWARGYDLVPAGISLSDEQLEDDDPVTVFVYLTPITKDPNEMYDIVQLPIDKGANYFQPEEYYRWNQ